MPAPEPTRARLRQVGPYLAFAALCYLPVLATRPGWISADTKSYLYLDPARLLSRAWSMWDPQIGLGTVSHQTIGYLWPMGPWYWFLERLGVPDWMAQRLWWGTLFFLAGVGVVYLLRQFAWPSVAVWPAAVVYALTPYVLTHIGRLSAVLLPYVGLPWLIALTVVAIRSGRWRHAALFALVVTSVGSINLTALALVGLGPVVWVAYVLITRQEPVARVAAAVGRAAVLTVPTSLWWLSGLSVQASHGIDIVRFTETAEVVARTSTAFEVLRGLGYWFFYGGDKLQLWLEMSYDYTQRPWLLVVTFTLPVLAFAAVALGRWRHQSFAIALVLVGTILAVGAHPWDDSTPFGRFLQWFLATERGLAFRSLPRVVPLVALGSALLIGAGVARLAQHRPRHAAVASAGVIVLAVLALAPLWQRTLVNDNLARQDIPEHWLEATALLDERDDGTRILELPGSDFASHRWGMTVDPITPGLTNRPYVARELVPHGGAMGADLLNAFDLRLQESTLDPASVAPLARLMRAGDISVRSDLEFERHNTVRPRLVWQLIGEAPGLGEPVGFGEPVRNEAGPILQQFDEQWLLDERGLPDPPPVAVVAVDDVPPIVALKPLHGGLLVSGDGAGLVDAAAAGLLDGTELVRYSADLSPEELTEELERGATLVVTDSNRRRGERWSGLRHNRGHTERVDEVPLREDLTDNRLPRFPGAGPETQSVTVQRGGVTADATAYGNPITYAGEERAARAVDGDPRSAWSVGAFSDARGERLRIRFDEPVTTDRIRIRQMDPRDSNRHLTEVRITLDEDTAFDVELDETSREGPGQTVTFAEREVTQVEVELLADSAGNPPRFGPYGPVGIAELDIGPDSPTIDEIVRVPRDGLDAWSADAPLALVFTRIRQDPTDRSRDDEERSIRRLVDLPGPRDLALSGEVRLSARADSAVLDAVLGQTSDQVSVSATARMDGSRGERAVAALDGDDNTAWTTPWGQPTGHTLLVETPEPHRFEDLSLTVKADGRHSVPTLVEVSVDDEVIGLVDLPPVEDGPVAGSTTTFDLDLPPAEGSRLAMTVVEVRPVTSIDWNEARPLPHPIGIAELAIPGIEPVVLPDRLDTGCTDSLLSIGDEPIELRVSGSTADALAGRPLDLEVCGPDPVVSVGPGVVEVIAARGVDSGFDLDQIVLRSEGVGSTVPTTGASLRVTDQRPDRIRAEVTGLDPDDPVWLVFGQNLSDGWEARVDGTDLGPPRLVDGFANGWVLDPGTTTATVELRFAPQTRVNIALAVSAIAILVCLSIVVVDRQPAPPPSAPAFVTHDDDLTRFDGQRPELGTAVLLTVAVGGIALLVAPPLVVLALVGLTAVGSRWRRGRLLLAAAPAGLMAMAGVYVVAWQVRYGIEPGMEWVGEVHRAHPVALTAVLALPLHSVVSWCWRRGVAEPTQAGDRPRPGGDGTPVEQSDTEPAPK